MPARRFLVWPDPGLRCAAEPVRAVDDHIRAIWDDMLETMYAMPGVGLAAPQIGISLRLAVVNCSQGRDEAIRMANPEILHLGERLAEQIEASPNLPGVSATVSRPGAVTIGYLDERGERVEKDFVGLWAASAQHQIDHLNGRMYFDRLGPVKRRMLLARAAKAARRKG